MARRAPATTRFVVLFLPALACATGIAPLDGPGADATAVADAATTNTDGATSAGSDGGTAAGQADVERTAVHTPMYAPPLETPGVPPDAELEASGAVYGKIIINNENIFDLSDPKDDYKLFRLANRLHHRTRPSVIRKQLLFREGQPYSRRLMDESERILRANSYFYDAWIRPLSYHDGQVDVKVVTRDVWTLNPGFNISRAGGTTSTGVQLEDISILGSGVEVKLAHSHTIDRTTNGVLVFDQHAFGGSTQVALNYANNSDGHTREFTLQQPFYSVQQPYYALDARRAAGVSTINDLQTDSLWDLGQIIDQFSDTHKGATIFYGWSPGLQNGWVHHWTTGLTYDEHVFGPVSTWTGATDIPPDRRFLYPWVQFDVLSDDYLRMWNHDQIARTEDFYLGTSFSARAGYADGGMGSTQSALILQSLWSRGFQKDASTLLLAGDFSGRMTHGELNNGVADASIRYYVEQSKNWLFFTTVTATQGWRLDLDNQILLGGDNGLRGYPLRYQDGTGRVLATVEQRYFTDWYLFRLFRVGGAVFFDAGDVWGSAPLAAPNYSWLKDAGFGLRFGNARSGLGNVVHVDLAFPLNTGFNIKTVQLLIVTEQSF
ncbi:MAG TPA: hypothetical protein VED45_11895 [Steroidobacteraceae bacterium]|nr:hypothetical protein [Steroidobacteraceae bacterium]